MYVVAGVRPEMIVAGRTVAMGCSVQVAGVPPPGGAGAKRATKLNASGSVVSVRAICPDTGPGSSLRIFSETGCVLVFVVAAAVKPLDNKIVVSSLQFAST